jgi:hypothetical protein
MSYSRNMLGSTLGGGVFRLLARDRSHRLRQGAPGVVAVQPGDAHQVEEDAGGVPGADPHARAAGVRPAHRHLLDAVAAALGEVEHFHVEDDAVQQAVPEEGPGDVPPEGLEAALGVAHAAHDQGVGQAVEELAEEAPVDRLAGAHVAPVRLDAGADDHVRPRVERVQQARGLLDGCREVGVRDQHHVPLRGQHGPAQAGPLALVEG